MLAFSTGWDDACTNALHFGTELTQKICIRHRGQLIRFVPGIRLFVERREFGQAVVVIGCRGFWLSERGTPPLGEKHQRNSARSKSGASLTAGSTWPTVCFRPRRPPRRP